MTLRAAVRQRMRRLAGRRCGKTAYERRELLGFVPQPNLHSTIARVVTLTGRTGFVARVPALRFPRRESCATWASRP